MVHWPFHNHLQAAHRGSWAIPLAAFLLLCNCTLRNTVSQPQPCLRAVPSRLRPAHGYSTNHVWLYALGILPEERTNSHVQHPFTTASNEPFSNVGVSQLFWVLRVSCVLPPCQQGQRVGPEEKAALFSLPGSNVYLRIPSHPVFVLERSVPQHKNFTNGGQSHIEPALECRCTYAVLERAKIKEGLPTSR